MKLLIQKILSLRKERDAYRKQLLFIIKQFGDGKLTYDDCQEAFYTVVKYKQPEKTYEYSTVAV